jgi:hypothetical protein
MHKKLIVWAVKAKEETQDRITTSYTPWLTQTEAIDGYTKLTGKSWEQLQKEGAELIQREMWIDDKSDRTPTT